MAKGNKSKGKSPSKNQSPQSSAGDYLFKQQAEQTLIRYLTKLPDLDEVLRGAGISRHRLSTLLYDDEIYQCVEKRQGGLEKMPFRIESDNDAVAKIITDLVKEWWSSIIIGAQNARWYGYSVIEVEYDDNALHIDSDTITPYIGWKWVGEKPMEWYEPKQDGRLLLYAAYNDQNKDIECDQIFKHFLTQCKPTYKNPYGEALLSRLYWLWFFKNNSRKMWAKFVERFGNPLLVGKSQSDNVAMRNALLQAHASSVIAVSTMESVEAVNAQGNSGATAFEGFSDRIEKGIQKLVLGQTLTSGTDGGGSRALGTVHLQVQQEKVDADIRMIAPTIQAMINGLCDLNGWKRVTIILGDEQDLQNEKADRDVKLKNAGATLTPGYFIREYGLQEGDVSDSATTTPFKSFSALPRQYLNFAAAKAKFTPQQQQIEQITDSQPEFELLNGEQIKSLFAESDSLEGLVNNLVKLVPIATKSQFNEQLDHALYIGTVMGFCFANEVK